MVQASRDFRVRVATRRPPLPTLVRPEEVLRECPSRTGASSGSPVASHGPGDAVSSSPWASPDAETLMLTAGVHSHPDLGRAVALPTLDSRLVGSPGLEPVIKPLLVPTEVPYHLPGHPDSREIRRGRALCMEKHWTGASGDTGYPALGGATPKLRWRLPGPLGLPRPLEGGQSVVCPLRPGPSGSQAAALQAWGLHQRRVCARWWREGHTQACTRPLTRTAHTWATNQPVRPHACLGLPCGHVLGHVCWPHTRTRGATLAARFASLPTNA